MAAGAPTSTGSSPISSQSCWLAIEDLRSREWRAGWVWCEHSRCLVLGASALLHGDVLQKWLLYDWPCVASLESSAAVKISCRIAVLLGARNTLAAAPVGGCSNGLACHGDSMHCCDGVYRHWYLANPSVGAMRAVLPCIGGRAWCTCGRHPWSQRTAPTRSEAWVIQRLTMVNHDMSSHVTNIPEAWLHRPPVSWPTARACLPGCACCAGQVRGQAFFESPAAKCQCYGHTWA